MQAYGDNPRRILPVGTKVALRAALEARGGVGAQPAGAVGVIVKSPLDPDHSYRVRFTDGTETPLRRGELVLLKEMQAEAAGATHEQRDHALREFDLYHCVIYRCVVGSRAYGLDDDASDVDRRGIYLPTAELHWSLFGVPEQLENPKMEEAYWELQKFLVLSLKGNPNALECLYTPLVEFTTPLAEELRAMRAAFLSRIIYQTYNGYVLSQFKKLNADLVRDGKVKPKHAMHLIRLLLAGIAALRTGELPVRAAEHRARLLAIKTGALPWTEVDEWRRTLHGQFDAAYAQTKLPQRPDYEAANAFLIRARRSQVCRP